MKEYIDKQELIRLLSNKQQLEYMRADYQADIRKANKHLGKALCCDDLDESIRNMPIFTQADMVKDFAEKLKVKINKEKYPISKVGIEDIIDDLLKEMRCE